MSYYTQVNFQFSDEPPSVDEVSRFARSWLAAQNRYAVEPVVEDLRRGWENGQTSFNGLISNDIEELMAALSAAYPEICLYVRGVGEEFEDVWLRKFEGGEIVFSLGPFESQEP